MGFTRDVTPDKTPFQTRATEIRFAGPLRKVVGRSRKRSHTRPPSHWQLEAGWCAVCRVPQHTGLQVTPQSKETNGRCSRPLLLTSSGFLPPRCDRTEAFFASTVAGEWIFFGSVWVLLMRLSCWAGRPRDSLDAPFPPHARWTWNVHQGSRGMTFVST